MLSEYFKAKTSTNEFIEHLNSTLDELKDKKVLLYGAGECMWHKQESKSKHFKYICS